MRSSLTSHLATAAVALGAATALGALIACGGARGGPTGEVRFHNQAPVWRVNDRVPIARAPETRNYYRNLYHTDGYLVRRATRAMDIPVPRRATDVNSLDEAPDSTWFTNRIGVRELTLEDVRRGPNVTPTPLDHLPWRITGAKQGGTLLGFTFEDARGETYLLKFDSAEHPELETGAHLIVNRILWACGYNVPQDYLGYIRRTDLQIAPGATRTDPAGKKHPIVAADVDRTLAQMFLNRDGEYRVLASRLLPGKAIGPFARENTRPDDPNDVFPHEQRRPLRGQFPIFAWLNHTDIQEDQSLDIFVKSPDRRGGYVVHYILDFGRALGTMGVFTNWQTIGYTYRLDWGFALQTVLTLGLWNRSWEEVTAPNLPGVGLYESMHFNPGEWRPNSQYWPLEDKDRFDAFWGAKILIRFTPTQLAAIVDEAQYTHPAAARYMLQTLIERQRMSAQYWFSRVAPLDNFLVEPDPTSSGAALRLCFDDLALAYELELAPTRYHAEAFDAAGRPTGYRQQLVASGGRACITGLQPSGSAGNYTIVKLHVQRDERLLPPVLVHLARQQDGGSGPMRVIGLRRE